MQRGAAASGPFLCHGRASEGERDALFMRSELGEFDARVLGLFLINHSKGSLSFPTSVSMGVSGEVNIYFLISGGEYVAPATLAVAGVAADEASSWAMAVLGRWRIAYASRRPQSGSEGLVPS